MAKSKYPSNAKKSFEADLLRDEYLKTSSSERRKRNFLMKNLISIWMPYVLKRVESLSAEDKEEVIQIYRCRVIDCLYKFKGKNGASFKSYLYFAAKGALDKHLAFKKKVRFEHNYDCIDTQTPQMMSSILSNTIYTDAHVSSSVNSSTLMYSDNDYLDRSPNGLL